jgi:hypothetical protein
MAICPTPSKKRYATREGAEAAAYGAQIPVGKTLTPYLCQPRGCGWWHLSKQAPDAIPNGAQADPQIVEHLLSLDDVAFRDAVADEACGKADTPTQIALRDLRLVRRWHKALGTLIQDVNAQLAMRSDEKKTDWGKRALTVKASLEARRTECPDLLTAAAAAAQAEQQRKAAERAEARKIARTPKKDAAALRAQAGDAAIKRLINAHELEFARYLTEECERLDTPLPTRIERLLDQEDEVA